VLTSKVIALAAAGAILYAYVGLRPAAPGKAEQGGSPVEPSMYEADLSRRSVHVRQVAHPALA